MWYILDEDKNPVRTTIEEWSEWREKDGIHVADEMVGNKKVSTVFLGLDHSFDGGPPLLFETMVFPDGEWGELECERYYSYNDAKIGHEFMVAKYKESLNDN